MFVHNEHMSTHHVNTTVQTSIFDLCIVASQF